MGRLEERLHALAVMSGPDLRSEWQRLMKTLPPKLSADLLRLALAYKMQERTLGGLSAPFRRELRSGPGWPIARMKLKPGTRLARSWNGRTIDVLATPEGYLHQEQTYRSLSHIAREVTGTPWSGPRFFGLKAGG